MMKESSFSELNSSRSINQSFDSAIQNNEIFDQNENIPEQIKKDPKKLLDYGSISKEERDKMREKISGGDGGTLVGAGKEDYEYLGIEQPVGAVDLHEEAKKKGGQLDMQDLMKLHGVEGA